MTLDAETQAFVDLAAKSATKPRHEMTPAEAREAMGRLQPLLGSGPHLARVESFEVPVDGGTVPSMLFVPTPDPSGLLVYFHGGGWVTGTIREFEPLSRHLAEQSGCAVLLVEYRKAPEHPYPGPLEDAWQALRWAADNRPALFGRPDLPLLIGGDSAGGNLAAVTAIRARDTGAPALAAQVLIYPVTNCDFDAPSYRDPANQLMLTREAMQWFWSHYAGDDGRRAEPSASPLRASDLTNLPPAIVITAEHDVLRDEGECYAEALKRAGVQVRQRRFDRQMHGFLMMIDLLPGSAVGLDYLGKAIRETLGLPLVSPESPAA